MVLNTSLDANGAMRGIFDAVYNDAVYNIFTRYRFLMAKELWTALRSLRAMEISVSLSMR